MNSVMDLIVLEDVIRPYACLNISKRDKSLSLSIAVLAHIAIFVVVGASFIKPAQFGMDKGLGSIEVNLEAASTEIPVQAPVETIPEVKSDFVQKEEIKPVIQKESSVSSKGKDRVTAQSTGGAISEAKPDYLQNPAPVYPDSARRRGQEGTVLLTAFVDKKGHPVKVEIEKSSGHSLLDEAAFKAVRTWQFRPALLGNIPVESSVRLPIRFDLASSNI